jgi:hypothetical protein
MIRGMKVTRREFVQSIALGISSLACGGDGNGRTDADAGADSNTPPDDAIDAAPPSGEPFYGWNPSVDLGTTADLFVDGRLASSGDGSTIATAFKTVQEAVDAAIASGVAKTISIAGDGWHYRETVRLSSAFSGALRGYGTDRPIISGAEPLAGWVPCDDSDAPYLGAAVSSTWKVPAFSLSLVPAGDAAALNLEEAGEPVPLVQLRAVQDTAYFALYDEHFVRAEAFGLDATNRILAITDSINLAGLTETQVLAGFAYVYCSPNTVVRCAITAYDEATSTITIAGTPLVQGDTPTPPANVLRYALSNCLPLMSAGRYGYRDHGDGTATLYLWPTDAANLAERIGYSARTRGLDLHLASDVTVEGLVIVGTGGSSDLTDAQCVSKSVTTKTNNITIRNCRFGHVYNASGHGYGPVFLPNVDDLVFEHNTVECAGGSFAVFFAGGPGLEQAHRLRCMYNRIDRAGQSAMRFYTQAHCIAAYNSLSRTGFGAHTNQYNWYEQCDEILAFGNVSRDCLGYVTWQEASNVFLLFNEIPCNVDTGDDRAIQDQANSTLPPVRGSTIYIVNNLLLPDPAELDSSSNNALSVGKYYQDDVAADAQPHDQRFVILNNIAHGGGVSEPYVDPPAGSSHWRDVPGHDDTYVEREREGNIYTALTYWQTESKGWSARASEVVTTADDVYTTTATGDFTPRADGAIVTHTGVDITAAIAAAAAMFPEFDGFGMDMKRLPIVVTAPRCGPRADPSSWAPAT